MGLAGSVSPGGGAGLLSGGQSGDSIYGTEFSKVALSKYYSY